MVRLNTEQLVELSVIGDIASPTLKQSYRIHPIEGKPIVLPSVGGISYNANLGDLAVGLAADHVEPGVSIRNGHDASNRALNTYACIGNKATVVTGQGKGLQGWVTGKHGGVEHVMVYFENAADLDQLTIGDRFQIRSYGLGVQLLDYPDVVAMSLSPDVLMRWVSESNATLNCLVTHTIPAQLLGAGLGEETCYSGDVDIQLFDEKTVEQYNLNTLRFGDIVAMENCDHRYGRIYREGWVSFGVVTHSCCVQAGHGPGVTTILTGPMECFNYTVSDQSNLKNLFH